MLKTKTKIFALCTIGLMICGSTGILAANTQKNVITATLTNDTQAKHRPLPGPEGVLFSYINVKAEENKQTNTGGYSLFYFVIEQGDHDVAWNVDYTVWYTSGAHDHGARNGVGKTITLGNYQISYGRADYNWQEYAYGSYQGLVVSDGNESDNDSDQNNGYDGEFGVDAGGDYHGAVGEPIQFTGTVEGGVAPYTWLWYFGDGNTSTEQNPIHAYNAVGQYEVLLTVTDTNGSTASDNAQAEIGMNDNDNFHADAGDKYHGAVGESIQFYGFAEGGAYPCSGTLATGQPQRSKTRYTPTAQQDNTRYFSR